MHLRLWRHALCGSVAVLALVAKGTQPLDAGQMDTHLTSTYFIARQLGYSDDQAQRIAVATWSMDLNANTTAMPVRSSTGNWWYQRGAAYHSLGDQTDIHARLVFMRNAVDGSSASSQDKLVLLGQYLHARQDVYFHQHDGKPYGNRIGHLFQGHDADRVAANFDASLRANAATYEILKEYRQTGKLPDVPRVDTLYTTDTKQQVQQIIKNDKVTGVHQLTNAVNDSYRVYKINMGNAALASYKPEFHTGTWDSEKTVYRDPELNVLKHNLKEAWKKVPNAGGDLKIPDQMLKMDEKSSYKIDYYGKDSKLLIPTMPPPNPATVSLPTGAGPIQAPPMSQLPSGQNQAKLVASIPLGRPRAPTPGGISLSMAAAQRLAVNVSLDGLYMDRGRLVLSGRANSKQRVDAALFFTALRLACEGHDPFFSLDADNGRLWSEEGQRAWDELWPRIRTDHGLDQPPGKYAKEGVTVYSGSAKRDYPQLWSTLAPRFPNLKARLVFHPGWLRETRFGEILYKADVLLKELDGGVPTLQPDPRVRAASVDRYASAVTRSAAATLLSSVEETKDEGSAERQRGHTGHRLWFDLVSDIPETLRRDSSSAVSMLDDVPTKMISVASPRSASSNGSRVRAILAARGYFGAVATREQVRTLMADGDVVDLSSVYPKMFVRAHDHALAKDVPGTSPTLNALAEDVNRRIKDYANAYHELRALTEVFRLYVAAVAFVKHDQQMCPSVQALPLIASEKVAEPMPVFHPTEIYFTVVTYVEQTGGKSKRWWWASSSSFDGGVSPQGRAFYEKEIAIPQQTVITREIEREISSLGDRPVWRSNSGRDYVALVPDSEAEFIRQAQELRAFKPLTKQMVLARLQMLAPTADHGEGLLDDSIPPVVQTPGKGKGMLDDIDPSMSGVIVVPSRR